MSKPCPYCGGHPKLADSQEIYGKSYGPMWICRPCGAYVGCHKGTNKPLGTLANAETRELRKRVHAMFDPLWKSRRIHRTNAYGALAEEMRIERRHCHIGMFTSEQCRAAIEAIKTIRSRLFTTTNAEG
jgi:hypothetical protein